MVTHLTHLKTTKHTSLGKADEDWHSFSSCQGQKCDYLVKLPVACKGKAAKGEVIRVLTKFVPVAAEQRGNLSRKGSVT